MAVVHVREVGVPPTETHQIDKQHTAVQRDERHIDRRGRGKHQLSHTPGDFVE